MVFGKNIDWAKKIKLNLFSFRTIYNSRVETVASVDELPPNCRPPSPSKQSNPPIKLVDIYSRNERNYIKKSTSGPRSADLSIASRFFAQTLKQYNRPKDIAEDVPYRSPRLIVTSNENVMALFKPREPEMESITRVPSALKTLPKRLKERRCSGDGTCYCDVLGPVSCKHCIEKGNRKIAGEMHGNCFFFLFTSLVSDYTTHVCTNH